MFVFAETRRLPTFLAGLVLLSAAGLSAAHAEGARIEEGDKTISKGQSAEFKVIAPRDTSSELAAWCEVNAGGAAKLTFDGEHYIPLSEPAVGDAVTLKSGETKRFELNGTIEKNKGDAYIAFVFTDVPQAMCFPGMDCGGAAGGAESVKVVCGNR
ncbi:hypothetical protein F2P47_04315 [Parvibaculum sedimenti]|uniref:Uncharacterized protein n=1 Tax=Parvibaculum sedimenti TaxID=2608632 RepID=A0A6N6VQ31_9HYPH|nr:hypothetical protein [Parvibaculum sedimenti]KAB7741634.1 hypothetical protein F2P47_04315 [Parvibaculum sedimenti]